MIRVLHVEDAPFDAALVRAALERDPEEFFVDHVATLAQAMERLQAPGAAYDVILGDMMLSDGDGLQLFAYVRRQEWPIVLIALTAAGDDRRVFAALKVGADDYIAKKDDYLERLPRLLSTALERHQHAAARRRPIRVLQLVDDPVQAADDRARLAALAPYLYIETMAVSAMDVQQLTALACSGNFDVLVLESTRSAADALGIVRELRQSSVPGPATVLVANAQDEDFALAATRLGISEYLLKAPGYLELLPILIEHAHTRAELAHLNAELERRVSERTSELHAVIRELEAFAHTVAHDLQAPARAVSGFTRALAEELGDGASPECQRILQRIERNAQVMHELIDDVLEVARSANAPLERALTDLTTLAEECIELIEDKPKPAFDLAPLGYARVDPGSFRQVFSNLLGNAVKFTRASSEPRVEIGRRDREGESIWFVRDNGVGFDMNRATVLFRMFQRLHRRDEFEGSGVGLAHVARIIERHGGRIWAEAAPGKGATFYFTIGR